MVRKITDEMVSKQLLDNYRKMATFSIWFPASVCFLTLFTVPFVSIVPGMFLFVADLYYFIIIMTQMKLPPMYSKKKSIVKNYRIAKIIGIVNSVITLGLACTECVFYGWFFSIANLVPLALFITSGLFFRKYASKMLKKYLKDGGLEREMSRQQMMVNPQMVNPQMVNPQMVNPQMGNPAVVPYNGEMVNGMYNQQQPGYQMQVPQQMVYYNQPGYQVPQPYPVAQPVMPPQQIQPPQGIYDMPQADVANER